MTASIVLAGNSIYPLRLADGGVLLLDAGPDIEDSWELAVAQASAAGFAPSDVRAVLVTHYHIDHAGLAWRWAEAGARILAGSMDVPALIAGRDWYEARTPLRLEALRLHGCPPDVLDAQREQAARREYRWRPCPESSVQAVPAGTTLALAGGATLDVLTAPGHTPGNLVAWVAATAELYSGDTLLPATIPTPGLHFPDGPNGAPGPRWPSLPPFLHSVRRLSALPTRHVLPGHGDAVDEPQRLFDRFEAHHDRRAAYIRRLLQEHPDTAYGLARRMFPRNGPLRLAQATTEVIGHLDALHGSGEAVRDLSAGLVRYRLIEGTARPHPDRV
jgi:glyoxylase-like metal-dependent hydrolase (beta-lactamase superfamily II)